MKESLCVCLRHRGARSKSSIISTTKVSRAKQRTNEWMCAHRVRDGAEREIVEQETLSMDGQYFNRLICISLCASVCVCFQATCVSCIYLYFFVCLSRFRFPPPGCGDTTQHAAHIFTNTESLISTATFCRIFPFHLMFDKQMQIVQVGKSVSRIIPRWVNRCVCVLHFPFSTGFLFLFTDGESFTTTIGTWADELS